MLKQINKDDVNVSNTLMDKITSNRLSKSTYRIIVYILHDINKYDNGINKTQKDIAKELNISARTVSRAFTLLNQLDIIRRRYKNFWVINPNYAYKGGPKVFKCLIKDWDKMPLYSNLTNVIDFTSFKQSRKKQP